MIKCPQITCGAIGGAVAGSVSFWLAFCALWIAGAVLIDLAEDKDNDNTKYRIGFILMMVATGFAALGCLVGTCYGGATAAAVMAD